MIEVETKQDGNIVVTLNGEVEDIFAELIAVIDGTITKLSKNEEGHRVLKEALIQAITELNYNTMVGKDDGK